MGVVTGQGYNKITWSLVVFPIAGLAVWLAVWLGLNVRDMGARFEYLSPNLQLDYVMGVLMWVVFAVGILMVGGNSRRILLLGWTGKFFVVLVAMLFYEQHYDSDAISYFAFRLTGHHYSYNASGENLSIGDLITSITLNFQSDPGKTEVSPSDITTATMNNFFRIFALTMSAMPPYFHAVKVGLAFIGFLGVWCFYRAVVVALGREYPPAFYLLAFFPSIIFWSSTLGKDPLMFLFIGLYAYGAVMWLAQGRLTAFWFVGAGLLCSSLIRPWVGITGAVALFVASLLGRCRPWQIAVMVLTGACGVWFFLENLSDSIGNTVLSELIQQRAEGIASDTQRSGGSGGELPDLKGGASFGTALLWIIFTGLFRPLPFDITNPFTALAAAENTVVLCLALVAICRFRLVYFRDALVLWLILFCLMWATLYGLIVMANFGTGVRYKLQVWPFFLMALLLLTHKEGRALLASRIPGVRRTGERT